MVVDIDECRESNICGPHANCTNQPSTYVCSCAKGYESKNKSKFNCTGTKSLIVCDSYSLKWTSLEVRLVLITSTSVWLSVSVKKVFVT